MQAEIDELGQRIDKVNDRVDDHENRLSTVEESQRKLVESNQKIRDGQIELKTSTELRFQQHHEEIKEVHDGLSAMDQKIDKNHGAVMGELSKVNANTPVWVTGVFASITGVMGIAIGALVAWGIYKGIL